MRRGDFVRAFLAGAELAELDDDAEERLREELREAYDALSYVNSCIASLSKAFDDAAENDLKAWTNDDWAQGYMSGIGQARTTAAGALGHLKNALLKFGARL